ncbi:MAG: hypothetical protein HC873_15585 [Leptolyngbyaceae cyanobacterium SL_1_1]|nr:hypothetical protein [Leptolyngbyaceae cyanobacterium SL_1_1]
MSERVAKLIFLLTYRLISPSTLFPIYSPMLYHLQGTQGKRFIALISVEVIAHFGIYRADEAEKKGMEVFAGGEAGGNGRVG